ETGPQPPMARIAPAQSERHETPDRARSDAVEARFHGVRQASGSRPILMPDQRCANPFYFWVKACRPRRRRRGRPARWRRVASTGLEHRERGAGARRRADVRRAGKSRAPIIRLVPRKPEVAAPEDAGSKSARTRERILDAAAHVLSRKGYAGTRLSDVADQAEIQAPAIYYYFPSRDDLIEEVMWSGIAHMREHMTGILSALPPHADP